MSCSRIGPQHHLRCYKGGPPIELRNGSVLSLPGQTVPRPLTTIRYKPGLGKATKNPPFTVVRFQSVLPLDSDAQRERQLEMLTALSRTCKHEGVWQVHLMVQSVEDAMRMFAHHNYPLPPRVTAIYELGRMPLNSDFVEYAYTRLRGEWVLACNDDIYLAGPAWQHPPDGSLLLSRHASTHETCDGCKESCDATKAQEYRSLCNKQNFGSFDAWVAKFDAPVTDMKAMAMLRTPRHAFGADNLLLYVFQTHLDKPLRNRCLSYKLMHLHCRLRTSVANPATAKRGYGDGTFITHGAMAQILTEQDTHVSRKLANQIVRRRLPVEE